MTIKKVDNCKLEIDTMRGVVYVHGPEGRTLLRICQIPLAVMNMEPIDITYDRELAKGLPRVDTKEG